MARLFIYYGSPLHYHVHLPFTVTQCATSLLQFLITFKKHITPITCSHILLLTHLRTHLHTSSFDMYTIFILSTLSAISFAAPLVKRAEGSSFQPAPGSKTTCDTSSDKIVDFYDGPQLETVVNDACTAMMAPCAYQERLPAGTVCAQVTTWPLSDGVKSTQSAGVETADGNKISGYQVQCKYSHRQSY